MPYVEVTNAVRLYVQDLGRGGALPDVVLVAGFGLHHEVWDRQVRVLTEAGHRVICVDQRGHGRSDKPIDGYEVETLAADLGTALERLDVTNCTLVGWSFGGQVAFRLAATEPSRVGRLVLVASNAVRASRSTEFPFGPEPHATLDALVRAEKADRIASRRAMTRSGFATVPSPQVLDWLVGCSLRMPSWAAIACLRSMLEADLIADLPKVTVPVLQVIGELDPAHSAKGARWLNERLPNAALVTLSACGHFPMIEAPDPFDDALVGFARSAVQ